MSFREAIDSLEDMDRLPDYIGTLDFWSAMWDVIYPEGPRLTALKASSIPTSAPPLAKWIYEKYTYSRDFGLEPKFGQNYGEYGVGEIRDLLEAAEFRRRGLLFTRDRDNSESESETKRLLSIFRNVMKNIGEKTTFYIPRSDIIFGKKFKYDHRATVSVIVPSRGGFHTKPGSDMSMRRGFVAEPKVGTLFFLNDFGRKGQESKSLNVVVEYGFSTIKEIVSLDSELPGEAHFYLDRKALEWIRKMRGE